jgi:hypothetical protein
MKLSVKSQAAMEFLMTYGWALLVILLVLAALAYFGMLNPDRFLPDKITVSDNRIQLISTQANGLIIKNAGSDTLNNLQINMTNHDCKISPPNTIAPGEMKRVTLICNDPITPNSRLKGEIKINYSTITYNEVLQKTAAAFYAVRGNYFSAKSLVGYWPLDNDVNDYSGFSTTNTNTAAIPVAGKVSGGYYFNGNSYITTTGTPMNGKTESTISAWVKINTIINYEGIIVGNSGNNVISLQLHTGGNFRGDVGNGATYINAVSASVLSTGQWYHLAATWRSGEKARAYLNGQYSADSTLALTGPIVQTEAFKIGDDDDIPNLRRFDGTIDEVMVFSRALSPDEIQALYQSGR